jgi:hypothetical protein
MAPKQRKIFYWSFRFLFVAGFLSIFKYMDMIGVMLFVFVIALSFLLEIYVSHKTPEEMQATVPTTPLGKTMLKISSAFFPNTYVAGGMLLGFGLMLGGAIAGYDIIGNIGLVILIFSVFIDTPIAAYRIFKNLLNMKK